MSTAKTSTLADFRFSDPKPNKMFTGLQHALTIFINYSRPVKCAYCGRMSKARWTQLKFFQVMEGFEMKLPSGKVVPAESFTLTPGKEVFPPLTPVCVKHILSPIIRKAKGGQGGNQNRNPQRQVEGGEESGG